MPFLLAEILNFQGSTHRIGVGSFSDLFSIQRRLLPMRKKQRKTISKTHRKTISQNSSVNRKYKDTLFRMIFRDRKNLLSLGRQLWSAM